LGGSHPARRDFVQYDHQGVRTGKETGKGYGDVLTHEAIERCGS